ncbi:MAG: VWA domain-containing protein [Alistipes sp.]|nr:VWA domain-containing protein [Alistipes sp.]MBQ5353554.1 VWA domain-containing protein [Alistipes sp.]MBR2115408.1 VWA domain-containing protein [Alistipes sp.]
MFQFANPHILWLLLIIPVMVVVLIAISQLRKRNLAKFGNIHILQELMPEISQWRVKTKSALFLTAVAVVIIAAARPQFGSKLKEQKSQGIEMMLVVDISNSMLAEDFAPNRLDRTRYAIDKLFSTLEQDRVGLVVFAGEAKVQLPITTDYRMARSFVKRISPSLVSVQGTEIGQALDLASLSFSQNRDAGRVMILITDGETHDSSALDAAKRAAEQGIKIFAIGIGTPEGAPVKVDGEFIKDEDDQMVVSRLNEELLQQITAATDGGYIRATNAAFGLEEIVAEIEKLEKGELTTLRFEEYNEQFQWILAIAAVLLLLESLLLARRNPRLKRFNIFRQ